jgi:hypothetical protein
MGQQKIPLRLKEMLGYASKTALSLLLANDLPP